MHAIILFLSLYQNIDILDIDAETHYDLQKTMSHECQIANIFTQSEHLKQIVYIYLQENKIV